MDISHPKAPKSETYIHQHDAQEFPALPHFRVHTKDVHPTKFSKSFFKNLKTPYLKHL